MISNNDTVLNIANSTNLTSEYYETTFDKHGQHFCTNYRNESFMDKPCDEEYNIHNSMIYRFKFTQEFMDALFQFSKVHQYDDRRVFKEEWSKWIEINENLVNSEIVRLNKMDYYGNIEDKMFKSARYYYRKKGTEKNTPIDRRPYVCSQKELLESMDTHIKESRCKPSDGFVDFCEKHLDLLRIEVDHMVKHGFKDSNEIKEKIKKTYKNRYFLIFNNNLPQETT